MPEGLGPGNSKMLARLFDRLKRTRDNLAGRLRRLLGGRSVDSATLDAMEELLYTADLGPAVGVLMETVREAFGRGELAEASQVEPLLRERLLAILGPPIAPPVASSPPHVIMVVGVNGSGKTTSVAKLARLYQRAGRSAKLAACDTFRAAASEQLAVWADRLGVSIVSRPSGGDPSAVAFDAADEAVREGVDVLLVDTAGRLHTRRNLMDEMAKISRVLDKRVPGAPHEVLLVLDATTGQNAIAQARSFSETVPVTGILVAKLDGTARGGALVSIRQQLGLPVRYVGLGEGLDDLEPFDPAVFVDALFRTG